VRIPNPLRRDRAAQVDADDDNPRFLNADVVPAADTRKRARSHKRSGADKAAAGSEAWEKRDRERYR